MTLLAKHVHGAAPCLSTLNTTPLYALLATGEIVIVNAMLILILIAI